MDWSDPNVISAIVMFLATCLVMIMSVLFFPKIRLGKYKIDSYWVVTLVGAVIVLVAGFAGQPNARELFANVGKGLVDNESAINPLKILVLFISMTVLSIFLDELQFFRYLASVTLKRAKTGQVKLFLYLYIIVSVLTVFTSNDIIILSFTPFICYFAKNAKINPTPYLAAEFVAANTWSLALIIGNPTNIFLASASGIGFLEYVKFSFIPTILAGIVAFGVMFLMYRKQLSVPMEGEAEIVEIKDKFLLWVGIAHLAVCTILLAISSYVPGMEMWYIALGSVVSLFIFVGVTALVRKKVPRELLQCLKRAPFQLIPFVLSMFVMILVLNTLGVTREMGKALSSLGDGATVWTYGFTSFLSANIINNIPMSVLFSSIIEGASLTGVAANSAIFATIIGSNIGAFLTPIGALAGIMWSSILNDHGLKFGYKDFLKIGVTVALPTMVAALGGLCLAQLIFL